MYDELDADSRYHAADRDAPHPVANTSGANAPRQREFSTRLGDALHEVPVPAGLADRILTRLAVASSADQGTPQTLPQQIRASLDAAGPSASEHAPRPANLDIHQPVGRRSRRLWLAGLLSTAAAAVLAWVGYQYARPVWPAPILLEQVVLFHEHNTGQFVPRQGNPLAFSTILNTPTNELAGQRLSGLPGRFGTVYELHYKRAQATLYVVDIRVRGLPSSPPTRPDLSSGGHASAAWQESGLAYVLVVDGGLRQYQQIVPQHGIAMQVAAR
ncbi:MAG: hypothetical protein AB7O62_08255 [Pirellulales bacterium]